MSLKAFHVLFITAAIALAFGMAFWCWARFRHQAGGTYLASALAAVAVGGALIAYEAWFLKKSRRLT